MKLYKNIPTLLQQSVAGNRASVRDRPRSSVVPLPHAALLSAMRPESIAYAEKQHAKLSNAGSEESSTSDLSTVMIRLSESSSDIVTDEEFVDYSFLDLLGISCFQKRHPALITSG